MVSHSDSPPSIPTSTPTNPPINTNITRRFDPNDYAGKSDFDKYVSKGRAFVCALYGSDRYAGTLLGDTREPPLRSQSFSGRPYRRYADVVLAQSRQRRRAVRRRRAVGRPIRDEESGD